MALLVWSVGVLLLLALVSVTAVVVRVLISVFSMIGAIFKWR
jgi:hypothetical protein